MEKRLTEWYKKTKFYSWKKYKLPKINYPKYVKKLPIDEKAILLESQHGAEIFGNIFHLIKALRSNEKYRSYKIYLSCRGGKIKRFSYILENNGIEGVNLVELSTDEYMKALATSKYLINDNTFLPFFIKRKEQVYLNTWHGTPLKTLGKSIKNAMHGIGNAQKNFVTADYLLYPNKYTMEHMVEDYMLEDITEAKCILSGYPRNSVFFKENLCAEVRKSMEIPEGMKIYAYMPTWRGATGDISKSANEELKKYLKEIDDALEDNERLYLNLHPIAVKDVDVKCYKHIRNIPMRFDTYDFLTSTDCLITDYSSVFFDYGVFGKKCVLFTYDEEEYFSDRGVYMPLSDLPFPKVKTVEALMKELRSPKEYDDAPFIREYCAFDCAEGAENILNLMLFGEKSDKTEVLEVPCNGRKNILVFAEKLKINEIEKALKDLFEKEGTDNNFFICFFAEEGKRNMECLCNLPENLRYFAIQTDLSADKKKNKLWSQLLSSSRKNPRGKYADEVQITFGDGKFHKAYNLSAGEIMLSHFYS